MTPGKRPCPVLEAGEDPDQVEQDMAEVLDQETPLTMATGLRRAALNLPAERNDTLYELDQ
ncbi:MAG: hypothetical protein ABFR97_01585 [Thermodesulfobacteriota bacterium]